MTLEVIANVSYRELEQIGGKDGQNSRVFRVHDNHLNAVLVVKEIQKSRLADAARYFTEARALHVSKHPRVVPIHWAADRPDHVCIAMPLMARGSLADRIRERPLRPSEVIRIGQDLCEGIAQVHLKGFVHLDVKPTNLLFDDDDRGALTDFGLALPLDPREGTADARDLALYPSFYPPEMMPHRGVVTNASDVYQIGFTLYRAINGEPFFARQWERVKQLELAARRDEIRVGAFPDRTFLPGVPLGLRQAIVKALDPDPALRQVGARQLAEDLACVEVKHDWVVEEYRDDLIAWRLRHDGRADILVMQRGAVPNASVEIWTETAAGRRRKDSAAWARGIRGHKQLEHALRKAFRAATT
jgi:serine/threonine protein kinase